MDWKQVLADLRKSGLTFAELARRCGVTASALSELASGRTREPRADLGIRLLRLRGDANDSIPSDQSQQPRGSAAVAIDALYAERAVASFRREAPPQEKRDAA